MKYFVTIFILFIVNLSHACLSAHQSRLFPIGYCSLGLVTVEVNLQRTEKVEENESWEVIWYGKSYLNIYDKKYKLVKSEFLDSIVIFPDTLYEDIINKTFLKGLLQAKKISSLVLAKPISFSFCDYQKKCLTASLESDTLNRKAYVRLKSNKKYEITILKDSTSIAATYINHYNGFDYENPQDRFNFLVEGLLCNSIRSYQIGEIKLTVIHLGSGQTFELVDGGTYPPGQEYSPKFKFDKIETSTFEEPVLHHGHGFDFFIIE